MTLAEIRNFIRSHTGYTSSIISDATADVFAGVAVDRMLNDHDWLFQQTATSSFTYGVSTDGYSLPADFVSDIAVYQMTSGVNPDSTRAPIHKIDGGRAAWVARVNAVDADGTYPVPSLSGTYYYVYGSKLYIVPQPTADISCQLDYLRDFQTLGDTNPFVVTYPRAVISGALREAYLFLHEDERAEVHEANFQKQMAAAKKRDMGTRLAGQQKVRG